MNPALGRVVAAVRRRPALALAVGGVGLVVGLPAVRRLRSGPPPADPASPAVDTTSTAPRAVIGGYGTGLTGSPLPGYASGSLGDQAVIDAINAGNGLLASNLAALQNALLAAYKPPTTVPGVPPYKPPPGPPTVPPTRPPGPPGPGIDYAGKQSPFGTRYPSYIHTAADAQAWIGRALAAGYRPPGAPTPTPVHVPPQGPPSTQQRSVRYIVRSGDSLSAIAARYGTPGGWQAIYALNRSILGSNPNLISPGQPLTVPVA